MDWIIVRLYLHVWGECRLHSLTKGIDLWDTQRVACAWGRGDVNIIAREKTIKMVSG